MRTENFSAHHAESNTNSSQFVFIIMYVAISNINHTHYFSS